MQINIDFKKISVTCLIIATPVLLFIFWDKVKLTTYIIPNHNESEYYLINKTVTADLGKHFIINFIPLRDKISAIQKKYPQKTYVYFLYLNNGSWLGMNERENFTAASTIKVPLAMAFYKAVEEGKLSLSDKYVVQESDFDPNFGDLYKKGSGYEISAQEALNIMLQNSDNTAKNIIWRSMNEIGINDPLGNTYRSFGWVFDVGESPNYAKINLKTLSNMFLDLYNAKYIKIEHSQKILDILSKTPFSNKIVAGVPDQIVISHKNGIAEDERTFSDCGIVYAPNRHYLLCLGSNGEDEKRANKFMAEISKTVYEYVISN